MTPKTMPPKTMPPETTHSEARPSGVLALDGAEEGERLDRFLARRVAVARNQVQHWILEGRVTVDGRPAAKVSMPLSEGSQVQCKPPEPPTDDPRVQPEEGPLEILYEDDHVIGLAKPAGLVVHPGAGNATGTLVHRLLNHYPEMTGVGGMGRPGIVHRLDRGTSGVMVVARTAAAYAGLSAAFAERRVRKIYLAVAYGAFNPSAGTIEAPIARHPERRQEMALRPGGRPAVTHYRSIAAAQGIALVRLKIETGRTHQIRVHLKGLGHPLVGDPTYGERRWKGVPRPRQKVLKEFSRPALHAWKLALDHPVTGKPLALTAPLPLDLTDLWTCATDLPWPAVR